MKKVFYPFLFAMFPILSLCAYNIGEVPLRYLPLPLITSIAMTAGVFFILRLLTISYARAGLFTLLFLVVFYCYGWAIDTVFPGLRFTAEANILMIIFWLSLIFLSSLIVLRYTNGSLATTTNFLNVVAIVLLLIPVVSIGFNEVETMAGSNNTEYPSKPTYGQPDIYYIVLDSYTRQDVLLNEMGFDNDLIDYLKGKGFFVADNSTSNYGESYLSMSSTLNMKYIDDEDISPIQNAHLESVIDSRVSQFLRGKGYDYIFVEGGKVIKGMEDEATVMTCTDALGLELNEFTYQLCRMTPLAPLSILYSSVEGGKFTEYGISVVLYPFKTLPELAAREGGEPIFVFTHILCPHRPNRFDENGPLEVILLQDSIDFYPDGYINNMKYINKKTSEMIDGIIANSKTPPVIILQGDHGVKEFEKTHTFRYENLSAFCLPDNGVKPELYETMSNVNTFRIVFNYYFDTEFELLEDVSPLKDVDVLGIGLTGG